MKLEILKNKIKVGSVLREGKDHFITVTNIYAENSNNPSYEYWENGYYLETNLEYITGMVTGQKNASDDWFVEVTYPQLRELKRVIEQDILEDYMQTYGNLIDGK